MPNNYIYHYPIKANSLFINKLTNMDSDAKELKIMVSLMRKYNELDDLNYRTMALRDKIKQVNIYVAKLEKQLERVRTEREQVPTTNESSFTETRPLLLRLRELRDGLNNMNTKTATSDEIEIMVQEGRINSNIMIDNKKQNEVQILSFDDWPSSDEVDDDWELCNEKKTNNN